MYKDNPSNKNNRKFKLTIGNDNLIKVSSSINLPKVINVLQLNHFLYLSKQDGFMYNSYLNAYKNNKNVPIRFTTTNVKVPFGIEKYYDSYIILSDNK